MALAWVVYGYTVLDLPRISEEARLAGNNPSVMLAADAFASLLFRVAMPVLILGASLFGSKHTSLPLLINLAAMGAATWLGFTGHAIAAGVLSALCLGNTWAWQRESRGVAV